MGRWSLAAAFALVLFLFVFAPVASAFKVVSTSGSGSGQTRGPWGMAVSFESGRLYVADSRNKRIEVFGSTASFDRVFGWGVSNGNSEFQNCTATNCREGLQGAGGGQFNGAMNIAVDNACALHSPPLTELTTPTCAEFDPSNGDVYVADAGNNRIEKFTATGDFLLTFGKGVNKTTSGDICTVASGNECGAGSNGFGAGEFSRGLQILVGVGPDGTVYVVDSLIEGLVKKYRLQRFHPSGEPFGAPLVLSESDLAVATAVDSTGDFWVVSNSSLKKFEPTSSAPLLTLPVPGGGTVLGLATDQSNNLFAVSNNLPFPSSVLEYNSSGSPVRRFGYGSFEFFPRAVVPFHSATGDVYVDESESNGNPNQPATETKGNRVLQLDFPPPGPLVVPEPCKANPLGNIKGTLTAEVNPEGKATEFQFEYVTQKHFEEEGFQNPQSSPLESLGAGATDFELHNATVQASLIPETKYHCRVIASNADGAETGQEGTFESLEPLEIGSTWASAVSSDSATLNAEVNPLEVPGTTGYFEYVDQATYERDIAELGPEHGFDHAKKAPDVGSGAAPIEFKGGPSGNAFEVGSAAISGLVPRTSYRFRIVATDEFISPKEIVGPVASFRTFGTGLSLLDGRAYEMVSPPQSNSAEFATRTIAAGILDESLFTPIQAAAGSGEAMITYTAFVSVGEAAGALGASQYLSRRTPAGWTTQNITPGGLVNDPQQIPFRGFTPDLRFSAFAIDRPALTPEAQEGVQNLYLRNNETGALQALIVEQPQLAGGEGYCSGYAGVSADGTHAFFAGKGSLAGAPIGQGFNLYEWSAGQGLSQISILPDGTPAPPILVTSPPRAGTGFGGLGGTCAMDQGIAKNAVSENGSIAFWAFAPTVTLASSAPGVWKLNVGAAASGSFTLTFKGETTGPLALRSSAGAIQTALTSLEKVGAGNVEVTGTAPYTITFKGSLAGTTEPLTMSVRQQLMARIGGTETVQLDAKPLDEKNSGGGQFWAATPDGSKAFFVAPGKLTPDGKDFKKDEEGQLYRYDTTERSWLDLTPGAVNPEIKGVLGASDDGNYLYFVAAGALTGEEVGPSGQKAVSGSNNLYVWHEGEGLHFIGRLSSLDENDWTPTRNSINGYDPSGFTSRVTPDGRHLAFISIESKELSGYDNRIAPPGTACQVSNAHYKLEGDAHCPEAYIYGAEANMLSCASCNPAGSRPDGPAQFPVWTNPFEGPRYLSDNGNRLFFESRDSLSPADENEKRDVYEFEQPGSGSCTEASSSFDAASGGCVSLISSGRGTDESFFLDASGSGRDVFFSTRQPLVGWDTNQNYDVYDAREGGGFPEPVEPSICGGESCKPPAGSPPASTSPSTPNFSGPGNQKPKHKKHKHQKHKKHKDKKGGKGKKGKKHPRKSRQGATR